MQNITYQALEKLKIQRPVSRIDFIEKKVLGKVVLDLGAYDETAFDKKDDSLWIHGRVSRIAKEVVGIDNSKKLKNKKTTTFDNACIIKSTLEEFVKNFDIVRFDVIIAGEFIEHLEDALSFLRLVASKKEWSSKKMIITTPNAASLYNFILAIFDRESTHRDHLQVYSYKTLHTLCKKAGFQEWKIGYYQVSFPEYIQKQKGIKKKIFILAQKTINCAENLFPMLSGGLTVEITI